MARTTIFDPLFRTAARKRTFIYWQTVPLHRLTFLLLALFCLFGRPRDTSSLSSPEVKRAPGTSSPSATSDSR